MVIQMSLVIVGYRWLSLVIVGYYHVIKHILIKPNDIRAHWLTRMTFSSSPGESRFKIPTRQKITNQFETGHGGQW
jgi:hypothetical protein